LTFSSHFDCIIVNETLSTAFEEAEKCIREFINKS